MSDLVTQDDGAAPRPLLPSERLRVMLATGPGTITMDRAFAADLMAEMRAAREARADGFVAAARAEAMPFLARAARLLEEARAQNRAALRTSLLSLAMLAAGAGLMILGAS